MRGEVAPGVDGRDTGACIATLSSDVGEISAFTGVAGRLTGVAGRLLGETGRSKAAAGGKVKEAALRGEVADPSDVDLESPPGGFSLETDSGCAFQR